MLLANWGHGIDAIVDVEAFNYERIDGMSRPMKGGPAKLSKLGPQNAALSLPQCEAGAIR